jgi:hypothetical protein
MKSMFIFLLALLLCLHLAAPVAAQGPDNARPDEQGAELTEEDKEIIRNLEVIENMDWLAETDLDLLEHLDLFLTNS